MSGAKNCPETPRQKMIGMMYLVLTAMLALNVSAEIISGFAKIRHSMELSLSSIEHRSEDVYRDFEKACAESEAGMIKYGPWYEVSKDVRAKSDEFYNYIENFKLDIANMVMGAHLDSVPHRKLKKGGDNTNKPHAYALNEQGESGKTHAEELEDKMDEFREFLTHVESPCVLERMHEPAFKHELETRQAMFVQMFNTDDEVNEEGKPVVWRNQIFNEMPAEAVLAVLTKYQNDIRTAENVLVNFFFTAAGSSHFAVNKAEATVIPTYGSYVMQGEHYRAKIAPAMVDTTRMPRVFINGREINGDVYDVVCNEPGEHILSGYILLPDDDKQYPFKETYFVGEPLATIASLDAKRIYSGYDNGFLISVPGKRDDQLEVKCSTPAEISRNGKEWIIKPQQAKSCDLIVYAPDQNGHMQEMGRQTFEIHQLPSPHAYMVCNGSQVDESVSKRDMVAGNATLEAGYGEDISLRAKFTVHSFEVRFPDLSTVKCQGGKFSSEALKKMKEVRPGREGITIQKVQVRYPDNSIVQLKGSYGRMQVDLK